MYGVLNDVVLGRKRLIDFFKLDWVFLKSAEWSEGSFLIEMRVEHDKRAVCLVFLGCSGYRRNSSM